VTQALRDIAAIPDAETAFRVAHKLADGLQAAKSSLAAADPQGILRPLYDSAARFAVDLNAAESTREQALRLMDLGGVWDPQMNGVLLRQWYTHPPRLRAELVNALFSQPNRTASLIYAMHAGTIPSGQLTPFEIRFLLTQPDGVLRQGAASLYGNPPIPSRRNIVNQFAGALRMAGSMDRGRAQFAARCGDCHRAGNDGNPWGMPLKHAAEIGKTNLLAKIIDPNGYLSAGSSAVILVTGDGSTLAGNVIGKNANAVTLCQPDGELRVLAVQNIQSQISLGISTMPEGLEAGLSQQDMADLLEFLSPGPAAK
jgi:putative heme-binding domain-containing protein